MDASLLTSLFRLADGSLVLAQRLSEWCGHGPVLEEDIALSNLALDYLGQARLLYSHIGVLEDCGRDEDALAYFRDVNDFVNPTLVELPNGDFGQTVLRTFFYACWQAALWNGVMQSKDSTLAAIAEKSRKETRYHVEHLAGWVVRLGDGTEESHRRMQRALALLYPYAQELFEDDAVDAAAHAARLLPLPSSLQDAWRSNVLPVLAEATLEVPADTPFRSTGRRGVHSEHLGYVLAEMQSLARAHPGASW